MKNSHASEFGRRDALFDLLAKPLHPEIFNKKPVSAVMESPTLLIDGQLRLEQVSRPGDAEGSATTS